VLIALLALVAMSAAWFTVRRLNELSSDYTVANRNQNAAVLARAKQALMGYVAQRAAVSGEDNPGAFPCPEAPGSFNSSVGTDGRTQSPSCPLPAVGRFPWRTIGSEQFVDAAGEPLWYVVASGWALGSNLVINSNCTNDTTMACNTGLLTVDGVKDTVALIIAPGQAMKIAASAGCTARAQARATPSSSINPLDYLECYNTATPSFVTTGPSGSFNDQVIKITAAELLPAIEAAIADRITHEIGPQMRTAYSGGLWPATPVLPYAVPFGNPTTNPTNKFQGTSATLQGLLPSSYAFAGGCACDAPNTTPCVCKVNSQSQRSFEPCDTGGYASEPRCDPGFVTWRSTPTITRTSGATLHSYSCTVAGTPSTLTCDLSSYDDVFTILANLFTGGTKMEFRLDATADNVGKTWRQVSTPTAASRAPQITGIDTSYTGNGAVSPFAYSITQATMNNDGSATVRINARVTITNGSVLAVLGVVTYSVTVFFVSIDVCYKNTISVPMAIISDHPLVDPTNANYSWIYRNKWHEVAYYAIASGIAPSGARSCTTGTNCLQLGYDANNFKRRGVIVLGGQKLGTQARPPASAADLLEGGNADGTSPFEVRSAGTLVNRSFNDRFGVVDTN